MNSDPEHIDFSKLPKYKPGQAVWQGIADELPVSKLTSSASITAHTAARSAWKMIRLRLVKKRLLKQSIAAFIILSMASGFFVLSKHYPESTDTGYTEVLDGALPIKDLNTLIQKVHNDQIEKNVSEGKKQLLPIKRPKPQTKIPVSHSDPIWVNNISNLILSDSLKKNDKKKEAIQADELLTVASNDSIQTFDSIPGMDIYSEERSFFKDFDLGLSFSTQIFDLSSVAISRSRIKNMLNVKIIKSNAVLGFETGVSLMFGSEIMAFGYPVSEPVLAGVYQDVDSLFYFSRNDKIYYTHPVEVYDTIVNYRAADQLVHFSYLAIPLVIRFQKQSGKFSYGLKSGLLFQIKMNERHTVLNLAPDYLPTDFEPELASFVTNFKSSVFLSYRLNDNLKLEIEPFFMTNIGSTYTQSNLPENRLWLETGFVYQFK